MRVSVSKSLAVVVSRWRYRSLSSSHAVVVTGCLRHSLSSSLVVVVARCLRPLVVTHWSLSALALKPFDTVCTAHCTHSAPHITHTTRTVRRTTPCNPYFKQSTFRTMHSPYSAFKARRSVFYAPSTVYSFYSMSHVRPRCTSQQSTPDLLGPNVFLATVAHTHPNKI